MALAPPWRHSLLAGGLAIGFLERLGDVGAWIQVFRGAARISVAKRPHRRYTCHVGTYEGCATVGLTGWQRLAVRTLALSAHRGRTLGPLLGRPPPGALEASTLDPRTPGCWSTMSLGWFSKQYYGLHVGASIHAGG